MKKILFALFFIPIFVMGQKTINEATKDFTRNTFFDLYSHIEGTYKYYYDEDDNKIMHGPCVIKGDEWWGLNKEIKAKTNGTATYTDGKLNGALTMSQTGITPRFSFSWSFKAAYTNGVPSGTWTYTETGITKNATITASITWKEGKVVALKSENGVSLTLDKDGYIVSGTVEGNSFKNGFLTNKFIRKNGDWSQIESEQKALIDSYIAGTISEDEFFVKGYIIEYYQSEIDKWFMSHLAKDYAYIEWFDPKFTTPAHPRFKVLKKVPFASLEEILTYYDERNYYNKGASDYYERVNFEEVAKNHKYGEKYLTDETIQQWKTYFSTKQKELNEKRAEEQRIAAEKRAEAERQAQEKRLAQEQRIAEQKQQAENEQKQIKESIIKRAMEKLASLSKFDIKVFGADVTIGVDYDNNMYAWREIFTCQSDLKTQLGKKLKSFLPFDSYTINSIEGDYCTCTIEKAINKKKKELLKTTIKITYDKIDLDESFDFSKTEKIEVNQ